LLIPVAGEIGINGLYFSVVLVMAMGIGLFAPPLDALLPHRLGYQ
jgi:TRAP-type C4-dicarboxylate transport system permease large subunit